MIKGVTLGVRVDAEMASFLEAFARSEGRTIANMVRRILNEWVARQREQGDRS